MKISSIILGFILLISCNTGNKSSDEGSTYVVNSATSDLPMIHELISGAQIEQILNLHEGAMYDTRDTENERSRGTFFKLDDPERPNGAILIQVSKNPMPEEFPDWDIGYIDGVLETGERSLDPEQPAIEYEPVDMGIQGVGNRMLGKYLWRDEHRHVYLLAFNITKTPDEIHEAALKIAEIVDKNY